MARITVENCGNRFELVLDAATRAKAISSGAPKVVECDNSIHVTALREIEAGKIDLEALKEVQINNMQVYKQVEELDQEDTAGSTENTPAEEEFDFIADGSAYALPTDENDESLADDFSFADENLDVND